jgi:hypothetical protein
MKDAVESLRIDKQAGSSRGKSQNLAWKMRRRMFADISIGDTAVVRSLDMID